VATTTSTSGTTTRRRRFGSGTDRRFVVIALALASVAAAWAIVGSAWILPRLSTNSDEGVYLLQAETLRAGSLAPDAPAADSDAFRPWFAAERRGHYILKYAPVHASVLAASGALTGSARPGLGAIAGAQVLLAVALARELGSSRRAALIAGALLAGTPLVIQLDITYLSYGTSLSLLLAGATATLRARRTGARGLAVLGGLAWGLALFARPYDAALFGLAAVVAVAFLRRRVPAVMPLAALLRHTLIGAMGPVVLLLAFNRAMTGDPLSLPFSLLDPSDRLGLGLRRSLPSQGYLDYTAARAVSSLGRNLLLVTVWAAGGVVGVGLAATTIWRRRLPSGPLLVAVLVIWPLGYALFWGSYAVAFIWDGALFLGPFYFLPMVAMLAIAAAPTLDDLWRWKPIVGGVATLAAAVLSGAVVLPGLVEQHERSQPRDVVAEVLEDEIRAPALVFIPPVYGPFLQHPLSFLRNSPELDGPILYALDRGDAGNARLQAAHPDRQAYRLVLPDGWRDDAGFEAHPKVERLGEASAQTG
jgi:hypothetical protein